MDSLAAQTDEIAGDELAAGNPLPDLLEGRGSEESDVAVDEDGEGFGAHVAEAFHAEDLLLDLERFHDNQHAEREERVAHIVVDAPEEHGEYLEYEEGGRSMLEKERPERGNLHAKIVLSPLVLGFDK